MGNQRTTNPNDTTNTNTNVTEEEDAIIVALLQRSYHLPNYTYYQDLYQYITNNHPVIGICCHHKLHPVNGIERILAFIGSICFGLALTNIIYLVFVFSNVDYNETYISITVPGNETTTAASLSHSDNVASLVEQNAVSSISITNGNIALWTIGATIHALYDNMIWQLASCTCCAKRDGSVSLRHQQEKYATTGTVLVMVSVIVVVALATLAVTIRQALDQSSSSSSSLGDNSTNTTFFDAIHNIHLYKSSSNTTTSSGGNTTTTTSNNTTTASNNGTGEVTLYATITDTTNDWEFLIAYGIELLLNYFIYYPIVAILLFSGIIGCGGRTKMCGGRPYEMKHLNDNDDFFEHADEVGRPEQPGVRSSTK